MNIYQFSPQKNYKKTTGIVLILACAAVGLFLFTSVFPALPYRWVVQLLGFACIAGVIFIATRYISRVMVYNITKNEREQLDFSVTELTNRGRSRVTVCRIALSGIKEVYTLDRSIDTDKLVIKRISDRVKSEHIKVFNYDPEINSLRRCYVLCEEGGELLLIKLASDRVLERYFREAIDGSAQE